MTQRPWQMQQGLSPGTGPTGNPSSGAWLVSRTQPAVRPKPRPGFSDPTSMSPLLHPRAGKSGLMSCSRDWTLGPAKLLETPNLQEWWEQEVSLDTAGCCTLGWLVREGTYRGSHSPGWPSLPIGAPGSCQALEPLQKMVAWAQLGPWRVCPCGSGS